jgi:ketosteroid isomerase-like protein
MNVLERLSGAMNAHDLEALVSCFHPGYESTFPAHPRRAFRGTDQVRKNWSTILSTTPDFRAEILRQATAGDTVWSEWRWYGTQQDGSRIDWRGVILFGIAEDRLTWGRLYMEPVEESGGSIDAAVANLARRSTAQ